MSKNDRRPALGKGLHSLLPQRNGPPAPAAPALVTPVAEVDGSVQLLPIEQVTANPNQPRHDFDEDALLELAQSIERDGIIQPILARKLGSNFQIIAGERRWRAAKIAGLTRVPVIIRTATDEQVLELAIIENIQRENLNPIELALAFHKMAEELELSHEEIGKKTGKQRVTVTNAVRLLQLPKDIQDMVASGRITSGHARALLKFEDEQVQRDIALRCATEGWSVRQIEDFTRPGGAISEKKMKAKAAELPVDPNVKFAIDELERTLGTRVRIVEKGKKKGQIEIEYYSHDDLNRIYEAIVSTTEA
jgi:ParB family transcriptional regulator, chromosome partitioning protein